jgi:hypothetical protein
MNWLIKHVMKACGERRYSSTFLTSALDEGELSLNASVRLTPENTAPDTHYIEELWPLPNPDSPVVQPVA